MNCHSRGYCLDLDFFKIYPGRGFAGCFFRLVLEIREEIHSVQVQSDAVAIEQLHWSDLGFKWLPQGHHSGVC